MCRPIQADLARATVHLPQVEPRLRKAMDAAHEVGMTSGVAVANASTILSKRLLAGGSPSFAND
jgi:hypothetical protein